MSEHNTLQNASQGSQNTGESSSGGYSDSRAAFSPRIKEFKEAMGLLYIRNNASGRNKFRHKWPDVAMFLFGEELIRMDNEGTQDRERRAELENQAGLKRIALKSLLEEYEDKSVNSGVLSFEYIGGLLDKLGFELGKLLYTEEIIARVRPHMIQKPVESDVAQSQQVMQQAVLSEPVASHSSTETYMTAEEAAEKDLAEQERLALRTMPPPPPQPLSLDQLQQEVRHSDQFSHMKIEISDDVRPIEVVTQSESAAIPPDQVFPQEIQSEQPIVTEGVQFVEVSQSVPEVTYQQDIISPPQEPQIQTYEYSTEQQNNSVQQAVNEPVAFEQQSSVYENNSVEAIPQAPVFETPILSEIVAPVLQEPVMAQTFEQPALSQVNIVEPIAQAVEFVPPPDIEKKPRIQIAGLRIKEDQPQETQSADGEMQGH